MMCFQKKLFHNLFLLYLHAILTAQFPDRSALDLATGMPNFINGKDYSTVLHKSNFYKMNCIFLFQRYLLCQL